MTQGKVTSLVFSTIAEKLLLVVDMWVTAVLNHPCLIALLHTVTIYFKGVKEQRVDGSSKSRNLDFVRCTLVAGKPVFRRKIHSHSDNNMFRGFSTKSGLNP